MAGQASNLRRPRLGELSLTLTWLSKKIGPRLPGPSTIAAACRVGSANLDSTLGCTNNNIHMYTYLCTLRVTFPDSVSHCSNQKTNNGFLRRPQKPVDEGHTTAEPSATTYLLGPGAFIVVQLIYCTRTLCRIQNRHAILRARALRLDARHQIHSTASSCEPNVFWGHPHGSPKWLWLKKPVPK